MYYIVLYIIFHYYKKTVPLNEGPITLYLVISSSCKIFVLTSVGRYSSVGIETHHGLDGPGFETRWGRDFPHPSRPDLVPTQPPVQWMQGLFPGGKERPGRGFDHQPSSSADVKERIEL